MIAGRVERALQCTRGSTWTHLKEFRDGQWLDPATSRVDQKRRLSALLEHAARHVPYYREILTDSGVWEAPGRVVLERFADLPLLDKATIRSRYEDLKSADLASREWHLNATGGSTGEPLVVIQDRAFTDWGRAMRLSVDDIIGRRPGERRLVIWGSKHDLEKARETLRARLTRQMRGQVSLNSFRLRAELVPRYVDFMNEYRPQHIIGYVESLEMLAKSIEADCLSVHSPRTMTTAAGTLQTHTRELLSRVFRSDVFNYYGTREVAWIATECDRHGGLHVPLQSMYLEVLREDGTPANPGEVGRLVVTSLVNYAFPLIRYVIGDLGAWAEKPCTCGRVWPVLREVTGRISDTFVKADGTLVAGHYFNYIAFLQDWVQQFQVVQEAVGQLRVRIVVRQDARDLDAKKAAGMAEIRGLVDLAIGEDCAVSFEFVDDIEPTATGKFRYTVSKVHSA